MEETHVEARRLDRFLTAIFPGGHPASRRIDIDLLRAVAVLAVIFFHFDVPGFSGGFLGVDMFFVISGYLITLHITQQVDAGTFSFSKFYLRRIRRLYPALVVTLLLTSIAAVFFLPLTLLKEYAQSLVYSSIYASNIYFWFIADYFDTESIYKPLLHTWSLSVEEQFYIFWPLFVFVFNQRRLQLAVLIAGLASFAAGTLLDLSNSTTFYLFTFRIFEFAMGALVVGRSLSSLSKIRLDGVTIAAAVAIIIPLLLITEYNATPNWGSVAVCAGTAFVIAARHPALNRESALTRPFLRIGLTSYSAYLVHWPLVVFYKILEPGRLSAGAIFVLIAVTLFLAELMYRFVEHPTARLSLDRRKLQIASAVPLVLLLSLTFDRAGPTLYRYANAHRGSMQSLLDTIPKPAAVTDLAEKEIAQLESDLANSHRKSILVIGDSHAYDIELSLRYNLAGSGTKVSLLHTLCDPLTRKSIKISLDELYKTHQQAQTRKEGMCAAFHAAFVDKILESSPDLIVFAESWRPATLPFLAETIRDIKQATPARILVLGRVPQFQGAMQALFRDLTDVRDMNRVAWKRREKRFDDFDRQLSAIADKAGVYFISKRELVCPDYHCDIEIDGKSGYSDAQHFTTTGMKLYGKRLVDDPVFKAALGE